MPPCVEPRQCSQDVRLDDVELIALVRIDPVQFAKELRVARVRAVHDLHLEAPLIVGVLRIERLVRGQQYLVELDLIGVVGEQVAEVQSIGGPLGLPMMPASNCAERWMPSIQKPGRRCLGARPVRPARRRQGRRCSRRRWRSLRMCASARRQRWRPPRASSGAAQCRCIHSFLLCTFPLSRSFRTTQADGAPAMQRRPIDPCRLFRRPARRAARGRGPRAPLPR